MVSEFNLPGSRIVYSQVHKGGGEEFRTIANRCAPSLWAPSKPTQRRQNNLPEKGFLLIVIWLEHLTNLGLALPAQLKLRIATLKYREWWALLVPV
jgi:hypothetical protein